MSSKADFFLKKTLGDDFFESLQKVELWKPGTRTTIDHEEIKTALHIVPRTVMSFLVRELAPMKIDDNKEIELHLGPKGTAKITATKHERDVYTGTVQQDNKVLVDFKYRSIPGIGLVVMSAFELYDIDDLNVPEREQKHDFDTNVTERVQKLIDERLALHALVNRVVEQKLMEKDAVQQLLLARLTEKLHAPVISVPEPIIVPEKPMAKNDKAKKVSPLGSFLEGRKSKSPKKEFSIQLAKGEQVNCPDCGANVFDGKALSGCICVGDDMERKVFLKKTEDGIKVRFSKGWDEENIEMLLEILRKKNG